MYTDLPEFTRCCFCAPLRIGLMAWGYIKLIFSVIIWVIIVENISNMLNRSSEIPPVAIVTIIIEFIDEIFTVVLLIAAHKKHERLFKVYYIYTIVYLVLLGLYCGLHLVYMFLAAMSYPHPYVVRFLVMVFVASIALLMMQGYIALLVRSEMLKLRDRSNIQFNNHAGAEPQCNAHVGTV